MTFLVDDYGTVQLAFDAAEVSGGVVEFTGGATYEITSPITYTLGVSNPLTVVAEAARIEWTGAGDGPLLDIDSTTNSARKAAAHIHGGTWVGDGIAAGATAIRLRNASGSQVVGATITDFTNAIMLENTTGWTEQCRIDRCTLYYNRHAIHFRPQSESGGTGGTESFARTQVSHCAISLGEAGYGLIRLAGGVYDSSFTDIGGNMDSTEHVFSLHGSPALGNTVIQRVKYEMSDAGSYFWFVGDATPAAIPRVRDFTDRGAMQFSDVAVGSIYRPVYVPTIVDSHRGNPSLKMLLDALESLGLIADTSVN